MPEPKFSSTVVILPNEWMLWPHQIPPSWLSLYGKPNNRNTCLLFKEASLFTDLGLQGLWTASQLLKQMCTWVSVSFRLPPRLSMSLLSLCFLGLTLTEPKKKVNVWSSIWMQCLMAGSFLSQWMMKALETWMTQLGRQWPNWAASTSYTLDLGTAHHLYLHELKHSILTRACVSTWLWMTAQRHASTLFIHTGWS